VQCCPIEFSLNWAVTLTKLTKEQIKMKMIKSFLADETGMETLEYAVIAGLIAVAAAVIYASNGLWATTIKNRLQNAAAQS